MSQAVKSSITAITFQRHVFPLCVCAIFITSIKLYKYPIVLAYSFLCSSLVITADLLTNLSDVERYDIRV